MNAVYFVIAFSSAQVLQLAQPLNVVVPTYTDIQVACAEASKKHGQVYASRSIGTVYCMGDGPNAICKGDWSGLRRIYCELKKVWVER